MMMMIIVCFFNCPAAGCTGKCGSSKYLGDGRCDDNNNNCGCNWDGGDCCGSTGVLHQFSYCKKCLCIDPKHKVSGCPGTQQCKYTKYRGDGRCDDKNNNCGCNWDGGDCCGPTEVLHQFAYCKECKCIDPEHINEKWDHKKDGGDVVVVHGRQLRGISKPK